MLIYFILKGFLTRKPFFYRLNKIQWQNTPMNLFQSKLENLVQYFLGDIDLQNADNRALRITLFLYLQAIVVALFFVPFHLALYGHELLIISLIVFTGAIISLALLKFNLCLYSKLLFITTCNLAIFFNVQLVSLGGGIQYFFGVTISLPFFMFSNSKKNWILVYSITLPIFLAILLAATNIRLVDELIINKQYLQWYNGVSAFFTLTMLSLTMFHFHSEVEKNEAEIVLKNQMIYQSEKMASLGLMASGVAHEINNPLTVIKGSLQQLKKIIDQDISEIKTQDIVSKIDRVIFNAERIVRIVKSLKSYSRNESVDPLSAVDMNKVLEETLDLIGKDMEHAHIDFETHIQDSNLTVLGRDGELIQVIYNVMKNAIDAIKKSEDKKWIKIIIFAEEDKIKIQIIDSGKGIPESVFDKLFEPFFTTKNIGEGTGLGLFICRNLVESMGGQFYYENFEGNTSFVIKINKF